MYKLFGIYVLLGGLSFLFGGTVGSSLTCLVERKRVNRSWVHGRSCCDLCGHTLSAVDLIPVFGSLLLRGNCRYCGKHFGYKSMYVELICGIISVIVTVVYMNLSC